MLTAKQSQIDDQRWQAMQERDARQDGHFFYGVVTTGVYCKASCASRRPLRSHVRFYDTAAQAEQDGLRPCKRCQPQSNTDANAQAMRNACQYLKTHPAQPLSVAELARQVGMSPAHFHRTFKRLVGVTPKEYADKLRMDDLKRGLKQGGPVTGNVYDSGFGSNSRVYERSNTQLGMTPAQYSKGGAGVTITYASTESPLGRMMIGATDRGLCFLQFGETHAGLQKLLAEGVFPRNPRAHGQALVAGFPALDGCPGTIPGRKPHLAGLAGRRACHRLPVKGMELSQFHTLR